MESVITLDSVISDMGFQEVKTGRKFLLIHVLYWILVISFHSAVRLAADDDGQRQVAYSLIIDFSVYIFFAYLISELTIPEFFGEGRKIWPSAAIILIIFGLYPFSSYLVRSYIIRPYLIPDLYRYDLGMYLQNLINMIAISGPVAGLKIADLIKAEMDHQRVVESEKVEAELKLREAEIQLLRGQIQPHFIFNTLNNIYSLSLDNSAKVPELLKRLNDMLSYVVYDCSSDKVALTREIEFIRNYVGLQSLRFDSSAIDLVIEGDPGSHSVSPLILQTFIDNSIKHSRRGDGTDPWISIYISVRNGILDFNIFNTADPGRNINTGGIGLTNVLRRLDLLYPDRYRIDLNDGAEFYSVALSIQL